MNERIEVVIGAGQTNASPNASAIASSRERATPASRAVPKHSSPNAWHSTVAVRS